MIEALTLLAIMFVFVCLIDFLEGKPLYWLLMQKVIGKDED